ncbi:hypothetical protein, partial [Methylobacterium radiotolerans]|uniref:hypothetical protein n=1 Tax=Methylobacterium radiotolerans TaxID=31998 RepID=UPI001AED7E68
GSYLSDLMHPFLGYGSNRPPNVSQGLNQLPTPGASEVIVNESILERLSIYGSRAVFKIH